MKIFLFCLGIVFSCGVMAQVDIEISKDSSVIIGDIIIAGNKKTKNKIILRELLVKKGDTLSLNSLNEKLQQSRAFVFNTQLFVDVTVTVAKQDSNKVAVLVLVKERWYIFPVPYFKLIDRNFNEWWVNQNKDLSRVNYGLKFFHNNLSGRNDNLNIALITGYNTQVTLRYENPFINKKLTNGFAIGFTHSKQKEINYNTGLDNKQEFLKLENEFAKTYTRVEFAFSNRPDQVIKHVFKVAYTWEQVSDSIIIANKNYYGVNVNKLSYADFFYSLQYFNTNYNVYPTKGFIGGLTIFKRGLNSISDFTQVSIGVSVIKPISKPVFFRTSLNATIKFPYSPNYVNQNLFGYGDFQIRGLENYVVDGSAGILSKNTLTVKMFDINLKLPIKSKTLNVIPFKFYGKFFSDFGYSHNPYVNNDLLSNKLMYSYGFGLDIVSIYDFVFKIEYSFNQLGSQGFNVGTR